MDERIIEISFSIIGSAGEAKFKAKEALELAREGKIEEARERVEDAEKALTVAHREQTELITKQANDEKIDMTVVLVHAQDHLMTTMSEIGLTKEFINVYEMLHNK